MMPAWILAGYLASCGADAASTHLALSRGAHELVLTQSPIANDVVLGAQAAGVSYLTVRLARTHPKIARGLLIASTAIRVAIVVRNVRVIDAQGRLR